MSPHLPACVSLPTNPILSLPRSVSSVASDLITMLYCIVCKFVCMYVPSYTILRNPEYSVPPVNHKNLIRYSCCSTPLHSLYARSMPKCHKSEDYRSCFFIYQEMHRNYILPTALYCYEAVPLVSSHLARSIPQPHCTVHVHVHIPSTL